MDRAFTFDEWRVAVSLPPRREDYQRYCKHCDSAYPLEGERCENTNHPHECLTRPYHEIVVVPFPRLDVVHASMRQLGMKVDGER